MPRNKQVHAERERARQQQKRATRAERQIAGADTPFSLWAKHTARELVNAAGEGWNLNLHKSILRALAVAFRMGRQ
jgi:hypothetical protein